MRAFWGLGLFSALGCGEPEPVYRLEFEIGFEDAVQFDLLGVSLAGEPAPCNASGGLEVEVTAENTVVDRQNFDETTVEVAVPAGSYAFFAQGYDAAGDKTAQGCARTTLEAGQTRTLPIEMIAFTADAVCGDGARVAYEQCDDGNTDPGDGCDGTCVTEEAQANTNEVGTQQQPVVAVSIPFVVGLRSTSSIHTRGLGPDTTPRGGGWFGDQPVDGAEFGGLFSFEQPSVGVGGARYAAAYVEVENLIGGGIERDIRVTTVDWAEDGDTTQGEALAVHTPDDGVEQTNPSVAVQDDGSFAVAWIEGGDVFFGTFDEGGGEVGAPVSISNGATGVALAALSDGNYVAAWDRGGAQAQRFGPDGAEVGAAITAGGTISEVSIGTTFQRDEFALVWIENDAVSFQAFSAAGAAVGADPVPVSAGGTNVAPSVAGNAGHWYALWANGGDVWGRYLASDGSFEIGPMAVGPSGATSDAFRVNLLTDGNQSTPSVAMNDQLALAVWADPGGAGREDTDRTGIRMRVLTEPAQ